MHQPPCTVRTVPSTATHVSIHNDAHEHLLGMQPAPYLQPLVAAIDRYSIWLTAARGMMGEESGARQCGSHSYTARKAYSLSGPNAPTGTCSLTHGEGKAVPLQAWSDPEGSRKLRFPDFVTTAQDGG